MRQFTFPFIKPSVSITALLSPIRAIALFFALPLLTACGSLSTLPRSDAKMVHYTQGMPIYEETTGSEYRDAWLAEHKKSNATTPWQELMARSVHAGRTADGRIVAKLHPDAVAAA